MNRARFMTYAAAVLSPDLLEGGSSDIVGDLAPPVIRQRGNQRPRDRRCISSMRQRENFFCGVGNLTIAYQYSPFYSAFLIRASRSYTYIYS